MAHPPHSRMDRASRCQLVAFAALLVLFVAVVVQAARSPDVLGLPATHIGHALSATAGTPEP